MIHGAGGSHLYWPANIRRLAGYDLYALDLPGHGRSTLPCQESILVYAESIDKWIRAAGLDQVIVVGHSMGSAIAITLALQSPLRIVGLGLLGGGARLKVNPRLLDLMGDPDTFMEAVQKITKWSFSSDAPEALTTLAAKRLADVGPRVLQNDFQVCNDFDITHRLGQISQPALVVCGQEDKMTPVQETLFLAENIPNAEFKLIPGAGHMAMLEKPDLVGSLLADFFFRF